jgi:hypothetical protein
MIDKSSTLDSSRLDVYYDAKSFKLEHDSRCDYGPFIPRYWTE